MQSLSSAQLPEVFASVFGLGAPVAYYPVNKWNRWGSLAAGLIFFFGGALAGLFGLYYAYSQSQQYGPAVFMNNLLPFAIGAGIAVLLGLFGFWSAYDNWSRAVVLYNDGLAYHDNKGLQLWRWDEVAEFFFSITRHYTNGVYTGTTYVYTLHKTDGAKLSFDNKYGKDDIPKLGGAIEKAVLPIQYKRAADAYNAGQVVAFGPVAISKEGITISKKMYPWDEVAKISLENGMLSVAKKGGGWFSGAAASVSSIPNVAALLTMIDQIIGVNSQ
ncbi:MAG: DUF6585 family protein [Anaerolineales bacterium]